MRISITNPGKPAESLYIIKDLYLRDVRGKNLLPTSPERIERLLPLKSSAKFPISWKNESFTWWSHCLGTAACKITYRWRKSSQCKDHHWLLSKSENWKGCTFLLQLRLSVPAVPLYAAASWQYLQEHQEQIQLWLRSEQYSLWSDLCTYSFSFKQTVFLFLLQITAWTAKIWYSSGLLCSLCYCQRKWLYPVWCLQEQ